MTRPRLLLLGGTGQIGWELQRSLATVGEVVAPARAQCDLERPESLRDTVAQVDPDVIVNAAAYTDVDGAESDSARARQVNAIGPSLLAELAAERGSLMVHYSTDYVFDGSARRPYTEEDAPAPLNVYGATKLEGELAVQRSGAAHVIVRTSWIYGLRGRNFLRTVLRLARERDQLRVVMDQIGSPTWSREVAHGTARMLEKAGRSANVDGGFEWSHAPSGVYHLAAGGEGSWYDFAEAILAGDPRRSEHRARAVTAITSEEFGARAVRPPYSVLDCEKAAGTFGVELPHWRVQLARVLKELGSA